MRSLSGPGVRVGHETGLDQEVPRVPQLGVAGDPAAPQPTRPGPVPAGRRRRVHPRQVATEGGRDADEDDRAVHAGIVPHDGPCASPTSRSSATSRDGSSRSSTCCARRTSRATRWPTCWPSPTTRRGRCGRPRARLYRVDRSPAPPPRDRRALRHDRAGRRPHIRRRRGGDLLPDERHRRARRPRHRHVARLPEPVRGRPRGRRRRHAPRTPRD